MQFGPCIRCGRIILVARGIQACGTCHILSTEEEEEQTLTDEQQQQQGRDGISDQQEWGDVNTNNRPTAVIDLQAAIGQQDVPQMLQRFLSFFNQDGQQRGGASEADIAALNTRILAIYDPECASECAICTELFGTMQLTKLPCNHEYHSECIQHWLTLNSSCPMCRQSINTRQSSLQNEPDLIVMYRQSVHYMDDID